MCLTATNDLVVNPSHAAEYTPDQLSSRCLMKSTTSSTIPGNSLIVIRNLSDVGT